MKVIDKLFRAKKSENQIIYHISETFGFGSKMVRARIKLLTELHEEVKAEEARQTAEKNSEALSSTNE